MEEAELVVEGGLGFVFEDFEQERELGDFDGLGVDIDAEEVVEENAFAFGGGELPGGGG